MTSQTAQLIGAHPGDAPVAGDMFAELIEQVYECAQACAACANACLGGDDPKGRVACITSCQNCGEVCLTTARALSRITGFNPATIRHLVEACEQICRICSDECGGHADMEHCRMCSEMCRRCADACRAFLQELQPA